MQVCTYVGIPWGSSICSLLARETAQNWIAFRGVAKATGVKSPLNNPRTPFKLDYDNILIINNQCNNNYCVHTFGGIQDRWKRLTFSNPLAFTHFWGQGVCESSFVGLSESFPHHSLFCGQLYTPRLPLLGKSNFCYPNIVTLCLQIYLIKPFQ